MNEICNNARSRNKWQDATANAAALAETSRAYCGLKFLAGGFGVLVRESAQFPDSAKGVLQ